MTGLVCPKCAHALRDLGRSHLYCPNCVEFVPLKEAGREDEDTKKIKMPVDDGRPLCDHSNCKAKATLLHEGSNLCARHYNRKTRRS